MKKLFLDDVRVPEDCMSYMKYRLGSEVEIYSEIWDIVRNYEDFVKYISTEGVPDIISFDHDLADEHYSPDMYLSSGEYNKLYEEFKEKTGNDCAKWLCEYCFTNGIPLPKYFVHSMNPIGTNNIINTFESFEKFLEKLS
jgi:hypothetical protein